MFSEQSPAPGRVVVKICGLTSLSDALDAIEAGADALGFNFSPRSKRRLDVRKDLDWLSSVPSSVRRIAVVADPVWHEVIELADLPFIDAIQLNGEETPFFCHRLGQSGISFAKALPVIAGVENPELTGFFTNTIVLDSRRGPQFGGTGERFDWDTGAELIRQHPQTRVVVSGGLTPVNVAAAVTKMRPFGVGVAPGVENSTGQKDRDLMRVFIDAVRTANGPS